MKSLLIIALIWLIAAVVVYGIFYIIYIPDSKHFEDFDNDEDVII